MKRLHFLLLGVVVLTACSKPSMFSGAQDKIAIDGSFELEAGPELMDVSYEKTEAPLYFFLFTHTEDQFNHELSEQRYWRGGEIIATLAEAYPSIPLTWTIEFQGADANTVYERNDETHLVDYLLDLNDQGLVHFGYHAQHEPTYMNRPQNDLPDDPSYQEIYDALYTYISCQKDPVYGDCVASTGGGLMAILDHFGEVSIVTGLGYKDGNLYRRSAGDAAVKSFLPDTLLSFAFADHGPALQDPDYASNLASFMNILAPTHETSNYAFWMDNNIQLNGASLNSIDGADVIADALSEFDRSRPEVLNVGYMSKYVYTKAGTSPTKYGYANPESPELPSSWLNSDAEIEQNYSLSQSAMEYFMDFLSKDDADSHFVSAYDIVDLFTSDDYWQVNEDEMYNLSLWLLNHWEGQPPSWAYDGEDYYSLTDSFFLLTNALNDNYPKSGIVSSYYGPWELQSESSAASSISTDDLLAWTQSLDPEQLSIDESIEIGGQSYAPAQVLYALAYAYALENNNYYAENIEIPATNNAPETYAILETLGYENSLDTVWSLKPARFQNSGDGTLIPFEGIEPVEIDQDKTSNTFDRGKDSGSFFPQNGDTRPFKKK